MKDPSRRQVVQAMLSASAMTALAPWAQADKDKPADTNVGSKLFLILHGSFAFVIWDHFIELLPVNVSHHDYQAGSRSKKVRLSPERSYQLLGVSGSGTKLNDVKPEHHVTVENATVISRDHNLVRCSIFVPIPKQITPLRGIRKKVGEFLDVLPSNVKQPKRIASVHVLTYEECNPAMLGLNAPMAHDMGTATKFHIWAEPDRLIGDTEAVEHNRDLSAKFLKIFPRTDLEFNDSYHFTVNQDPIKAGDIDEENLPGNMGNMEDGDVDAGLLLEKPARPPAICQSFIANNQS